jgi:hypothetical protein
MRRVMGAVLAAALQASAADPIFWFVRSGQSLSVGSVGWCSSGSYPPCSSGAAYGSLTIFAPNSMYPPADSQFRTLSGHNYQNASPAIESSATSMCNQYAALSGRICGTADYGWPGAAFGYLAKTETACPNCPYRHSLGTGSVVNTGAVQAKALANAQGRTLYVPGVYFNQGESEMNSSTSAATYGANMVALQAAYETDINAAISQTGRIPLFIRQKSSWAAWGGARSTPTTTGNADGVPTGQLKSCLDHYTDGRIFCVGPDYDTPYTADGVHKPAHAYRGQGGREGAALYRVTVLKQGWRPFHPRSITISGPTINVRFWTPTGAPIQFDTTNIAALPDGHYGLELTDTGGTDPLVTISSVAIVSADTVRITLSGTPAGTVELRYAWTAPNGACPSSCSANGSNYSGPTNGPRGNVADSVGTSWNGDPLTNYALTFRIPGISAAAPYTWTPSDPDLSSVAGAPGPNRGAMVNGKAAAEGKAAIR